MAKAKLCFGVVCDFRNPADSEMSHPALYAAIPEQVAWLDRLGLDHVWFTERQNRAGLSPDGRGAATEVGDR